ncbi:hypothetical protein [Aureliella helgolandensis]|uniref:Uncharacterized protein n=1 Tax=Aureliella helgolandensis TaxID=2527968 RepID=A0A518G1V5_9BACT|nr:hypothetical protein [Aureliella helgolandensis]QDV22586.1 hypothetical protein Q31a_08720 [Aureliella helgolandensis]
MKQHSSDTWKQLLDLLASSAAPHGLNCLYPADVDRRLSLLDALGNSEIAASTEQAALGSDLQSALSGLAKQLSMADELSRCPIVAITGLLNAGKSSLLATYLSPESRRRVLRGLSNHAGTHRFVLWLPQAWWDNPQLFATLLNFLTELFGHPPEKLSDDPTQAMLQYNGQVLSDSLLTAPHSATESITPPPARLAPHNSEGQPSSAVDPLGIPLIAYDASLDSLKLGLIDCPDIQTGFLAHTTTDSERPQGQAMAWERRQQLVRIGRLCSAFIVVSKLNSLHDEGLLQILTALRDAMPGVPRILAVNKVKARYLPDTVLEQARELVDRFGVQAVYTAYDFRSALAHTCVPPPPPRMLRESSQEQLPIFYETQAVTTASDPKRYLHDLGEQLDAGTLARESCRSLTLQLNAKIAAAISWLDKNQTMQEQRLQDAWQTIAEACYEFMAVRDKVGSTTGLRLQASPAIVAQMADSLQRTAPLWLRLSLSIDRTARQFQQAIANSASRLKILQSASQSVKQLASRFRRGEGATVVTPDKLAETLRRCDSHDALQEINQDCLVGDCDVAMKRFAAEDQSRLDEQDLDAWSRQVWQGMSFTDKLWKGTQPLALVMGPLLAAILVPFDAGGTAVLVFASSKELLAAAGIAAVMTGAGGGGEALSIVQRETPWRQLSDLFACVCDGVGIPRPTEMQLPLIRCATGTRRLLPSTLDTKRSSSEAALQQWRASTEFRQDLQALLSR